MSPDNIPNQTPETHNQPMPAPQQTTQTHDNTQVSSPETSPALPYDSNPFTISINGFQLLIKYAQSVVITILVLALLSFTLNLVGDIISSFSEKSASAQQDDVSETLDSLQDDFQLDFNDQDGQTMQDIDSNSSPVDTQTIVNIALIVVGVVLVILLISLPIGIAFSAAFKGFVAAGMIAALQHRKISFGEAFSAMTSRFGTLFVAELIAILKIIGGYLLFIIPGIRAQLRYEALPYVIMSDSQIGAKAAISHTKDLYKNHLMEVFGIKFFAGIVPAIGQAFAAGGIGLSMQQLQAYKQAQLATPKTHWLNYLGVILGSLLLVGTAGLVIVIFMIVSSSS